jgi:hypothetical protein
MEIWVLPIRIWLYILNYLKGGAESCGGKFRVRTDAWVRSSNW